MMYSECNGCKLRRMAGNDDICKVCGGNRFPTYQPERLWQERDFSQIKRGGVYGGNSRTIFEKFCDTLGWDRGKIGQFGWQTPLYAMNADTDRKNDVWFICYPNYDLNRLDSVVENRHVINVILNNGDNIIEIVAPYLGTGHHNNRVTFVKTRLGYAFLGVYRIAKNGTTRIYERISDIYPIKEN